MYIDLRQKEIVKKAIEDYDFIKEEIDEKIAKDYNLKELSKYLVKLSNDVEITNLEDYHSEYAYLDFMYKNLNMYVSWDVEKGVRVSPTFEIYDKDMQEYIVDDFLSKEEYQAMLNRSREDNLEDLVATLKFYDSNKNKAYSVDYNAQVKKIINFLEENW